MPRTTETVSVSLPRATRRQLERLHKQEKRSRSAVMCEALQAYFAMRLPAEELTAAEHAAIERGRAEIARGEYLTLEELHESLANPNFKAVQKKTSQNYPPLTGNELCAQSIK